MSHSVNVQTVTYIKHQGQTLFQGY